MFPAPAKGTGIAVTAPFRGAHGPGLPSLPREAPVSNVTFGDVSGGTIIGAGASGVIGQTVTIHGGVQVGEEALRDVPDEYARSLQAFQDAINQQLQALGAPPESVAPVQEGVQALAEEAKAVQPEQPLDWKRKRGIGDALRAIAAGLLQVIPRTAETIAAMTPLAPFSKLIGEGLEKVVAEVRGEPEPAPAAQG
jgi:hypothetical protein